MKAQHKQTQRECTLYTNKIEVTKLKGFREGANTNILLRNDLISFNIKNNKQKTIATTKTNLLQKYTNTDKCRKIVVGKPPATLTRVIVYTNTLNT